MLSPRFAILITASRCNGAEVGGTGPSPVASVAGYSGFSDRQRETDRDRCLGEEGEGRFEVAFTDRTVGCSNTARRAVDDPALRGFGIAFDDDFV